jgi:molybdopterin synthase sulfur carrier subunit
MKVDLKLFGAFRDLQPHAQLLLELPDGARVADLRRALANHAQANWPGFQPGLLARSAFASDAAVLRDGEALPADGRMALLPPVSGG